MSRLPAGDKQPIESKLAWLTFLASAIPSLALILCLWAFDTSSYLIGIVFILLLFLNIWSVTTVWRKTQFHYRSLHNLLDAIVSGDYSFRGRVKADGSFDALINTINALATTLQRQRLRSEESQLLVQKVVDQIDVAIIAWDQRNNIRLINPAASQLLRIEREENGLPAALTQLPLALDFVHALELRKTLLMDLDLAVTVGRFRLYMERFISEGDIHNLLFITNVSEILRSAAFPHTGHLARGFSLIFWNFSNACPQASHL